MSSAHKESKTIKKIYFRYEESLLERGVKSVAVEFKWMKDESLSEDFFKVKKGFSILQDSPCFVLSSGFFCPLCAAQGCLSAGISI